MQKSIIIHTEDPKKLKTLFHKIEVDLNKSDYSLILHCRNYFPWEDEELKKHITTFSSFYAFPTNLDPVKSVVELIIKSKADELLIISEDLDIKGKIDISSVNYDFFYCERSHILSLKLDTNYNSLRWFIIDLISQKSDAKVFFKDSSDDCERYTRKISHPLFKERIIYIDGGLGDHVMAIPLLRKIGKNVFVSCKYEFVFNHLSLKGFVNWSEELFGGYNRSVYEYGSSNNSPTIIDAFFSMYGYERQQDDILIYEGERKPNQEINTTQKIALICTSAAKINGLDSNKDWKEVRWLKLVHELRKKNYYVIQVGTTSDNQIPNVDYRFLDKSISNLASLIDICHLWISVDTFFHHFASSIKPSVGICLTPFYNDHAKHAHVTYIEKDSGKNFYDKRWWMDLQQPERKECMDLISVEEVLSTIDKRHENRSDDESKLKLNVFTDGIYTGWINNQDNNWWLDTSVDHSFNYYDLDYFYNADYFKEDHVGQGTTDNYFKYLNHYFETLTGNKIKSVLEFGTAGGWFTKKFFENGFDIIGLEGSECGINATKLKGLPQDRLIRHDFRNPINLGRKFDVACCTEVAEHVEIPFAGTLIRSLVEHSDFIWFSSVEPNVLGLPSNYHHVNEQPEIFWINLFKYFNYDYVKLPDHVYNDTQLRARFVFYNKAVYDFNNKGQA